jgi:UDP-glucuronate 4-epimerase
VDDIVEGVLRVHDRPPAGPGVRAKIYNIGNSTPVDLMEFIATLEKLLGKSAEKQMLPMQPGDVPATFADVADLERDVGFRPRTSLEDGLGSLVRWYREFYGV